MKIKSFILAAAILLAQPVAGHAASTMLTTGSTSQPIGHAMFCEQFRSECLVRSSDDTAPQLTKKRWADIQEINTYANHAIKPVTDQDYYGVEENWTYPRQYGDCEDYALLKRYMLLQRGWPASSLLITVVKQSNGEGHAVLTVRTGNGDFILDNLETSVKRWDQTAYRYLKRQSTRHSGAWTGINDRRRQVARY